jgi:hypothetical protein
VTSSLASPVEVLVDVPEGKDVEIAVVVPAGARVDGVVVDRDGKPVGKASVELTPVVPDGPTRPRDAPGPDRRCGALRGREPRSHALARHCEHGERHLRVLGTSFPRVAPHRARGPWARWPPAAVHGTLPADVEVRRTRGEEILCSSAAVRDGRVEFSTDSTAPPRPSR